MSLYPDPRHYSLNHYVDSVPASSHLLKGSVRSDLVWMRYVGMDRNHYQAGALHAQTQTTQKRQRLVRVPQSPPRYSASRIARDKSRLLFGASDLETSRHHFYLLGKSRFTQESLCLPVSRRPIVLDNHYYTGFRPGMHRVHMPIIDGWHDVLVPCPEIRSDPEASGGSVSSSTQRNESGSVGHEYDPMTLYARSSYSLTDKGSSSSTLDGLG